MIHQLLLNLTSPAFAATVTQEFCVQHATDYDELIPFGTWWTTNTNRDLFGIEVSAVDFNGVVNSAFTAENGSSSGCVTLLLDDNQKYIVSVNHRADIYGRLLYAVDTKSASSSTADGIAPLIGWVPTGSTETMVVPYSREFGALNVAGWMFRRDSFGLSTSGHDLRIAIPGDGAGTKAGVSYIQINTDRKRAMSHEVGHWIGHRRDENNTTNSNQYAPEYFCSGGGNDDLVREFDSRAAQEVWADYVAAWAWNTQNLNRCALQKLDTSWDFDLDGDGDADASGSIVPRGQWGCEGAMEDFNSDGDLYDAGEVYWSGWGTTDTPDPWPLTSDWLAHLATADDDDIDGLQCTGPLDGVSTKADWVRFFWDFCRDYSITATDCASVWDLANPKNWDPTPENSGNVNDDPIRRIEDAADTLGFSTEFANEAHNGLDHY